MLVLDPWIGYEPGCRMSTRGRLKVFFGAWSMDVKIEGENAVRHLDITTGNHASPMANAATPFPHIDAMMKAIRVCYTDGMRAKEACDPWEKDRGCPEEHERRIERADRARTKAREAAQAAGRKYPKYGSDYDKANAKLRDEYLAYTQEINRDPCRRALRCILIPYKNMEGMKCPKQTGEHLIESGSFKSHPNYKEGEAPTAFTDGPSYHLGEHGLISLDRADFIEDWRTKNPGKDWTVGDGAELGAKVHHEQNGHCNEECTKQQILAGHQKMGLKPTDPIHPPAEASDKSAADRKIMELSRDQLADELQG